MLRGPSFTIYEILSILSGLVWQVPGDKDQWALKEKFSLENFHLIDLFSNAWLAKRGNLPKEK